MDLSQSIAALNFAKKIIGNTENVIINSNISNKKKDIIIISGNENKPINLCDVIDAFTKMQGQFSQTGSDKSYFAGISYNNEENMYNIYWDI